MATTTMNVKLLQIVKTTAQWEAWDEANAALTTPVVLSAGLLLVEDCGSGVTRVKVGNGSATQFANLEYISYPAFGGADGTHEGTTGFVPAPSATDSTKFLKGDGTWADTPAAPSYTAEAGGQSGASSGSYDQVILKMNGATVSTVDLGLFADSASGKDEAGKIKSALLPSYVDDIIEGYYNPTDGKFYTSKSGSTYSGEITPSAGVIYVDLDTDGSYRWGGSEYVNISNPIDAQAIYNLMDTDTNGAYSTTKHGLVPAYGTTTGGDKKILRGDGWASLTNGTGISIDNTTTANTTAISIAAAGTSTLGGVSVAANSGLTLNNGAIAVNTSTGLSKDSSTGAITVAAAGTSDLGGVSIASTSAISNSSGAVDVKLASNGGITKNGSSELQVADFTGANGTAAGTHGLVKAPTATDNTKYLKGDGTWSALPEMTGATSLAAGTSGLVPAPSAGDEGKVLTGAGTWADVSSIGVSDVTVDGTTIVSDGVAALVTDASHSYDATTNSGKLATVGTVTAAINDLDVPSTGTGAITGMGAGKTISTLTEEDGKIAATFQDISIAKSQVSDFPTNIVNDVSYGKASGESNPTLKVTKNDGNATAIVTVTDNSSATALSDSSTNLVTERSVANAGYIKNVSINGTSGTTFTGLATGARVRTDSGTADLGLVTDTTLIDLTDLVLQCTL